MYQVRDNRTKEVISSHEYYLDANLNLTAGQHIFDTEWRRHLDAEDYEFIDLGEFGLDETVDHFLRVANDNEFTDPSLLISFIKSEDDGGREKWTTMKIGRYLKRYYPDIDVEETASNITAFYNNLEVKFATTREDIRDVYERADDGPHRCNSCMTGPVSKFSSNPVHPAEAYAAGDLAVAYIERDGDILARTVCWPERKVYSKFYGGEWRKLKTLLEKDGYDSNDLCGARLLKIVTNDTDEPDKTGRTHTLYAVPYIDSDGNAVIFDDSGELRIARYNDRGRYATSTAGVIEIEQYFCVISGRQLDSTTRITFVDPNDGHERNIHRDLVDDLTVMHVRGHSWLIQDPDTDLSEIRPGFKVPNFIRRHYYHECYVTKKLYDSSDMCIVRIRSVGNVRVSYPGLTGIATCPVTQITDLKSNLVRMFNGDYWSPNAAEVYAFRGPDGQFYPNGYEVQEAA